MLQKVMPLAKAVNLRVAERQDVATLLLLIGLLLLVGMRATLRAASTRGAAVVD